MSAIIFTRADGLPGGPFCGRFPALRPGAALQNHYNRQPAKKQSQSGHCTVAPGAVWKTPVKSRAARRPGRYAAKRPRRHGAVRQAGQDFPAGASRLPPEPDIRREPERRPALRQLPSPTPAALITLDFNILGGKIRLSTVLAAHRPPPHPA